MAASPAERAVEARTLAEMLQALNTLPKPLIGRLQGQAFGGGVGPGLCLRRGDWRDRGEIRADRDPAWADPGDDRALCDRPDGRGACAAGVHVGADIRGGRGGDAWHSGAGGDAATRWTRRSRPRLHPIWPARRGRWPRPRRWSGRVARRSAARRSTPRSPRWSIAGKARKAPRGWLRSLPGANRAGRRRPPRCASICCNCEISAGAWQTVV